MKSTMAITELMQGIKANRVAKSHTQKISVTKITKLTTGKQLNKTVGNKAKVTLTHYNMYNCVIITSKI